MIETVQEMEVEAVQETEVGTEQKQARNYESDFGKTEVITTLTNMT